MQVNHTNPYSGSYVLEVTRYKHERQSSRPHTPTDSSGGPVAQPYTVREKFDASGQLIDVYV